MKNFILSLIILSSTLKAQAVTSDLEASWQKMNSCTDPAVLDAFKTVERRAIIPGCATCEAGEQPKCVATRPKWQGSKADGSNCTFYNCLAKKMPQCSGSLMGYKIATNDNYAWNYGRYYCLKFGCRLMNGGISSDAKIWLENTMYCLQKEIEVYLDKNPSPSCGGLKQFAFASHVPCYTGTSNVAGKYLGVCFLPTHDMVKISLTPELQDLLTSDTYRQIMGTIHNCSKGSYWGSNLAGYIEFMSEKGQVGLEEAVDIYQNGPEFRARPGEVIHEIIYNDCKGPTTKGPCRCPRGTEKYKTTVDFGVDCGF